MNPLLVSNIRSASRASWTFRRKTVARFGDTTKCSSPCVTLITRNMRDTLNGWAAISTPIILIWSRETPSSSVSTNTSPAGTLMVRIGNRESRGLAPAHCLAPVGHPRLKNAIPSGLRLWKASFRLSRKKPSGGNDRKRPKPVHIIAGCASAATWRLNSQCPAPPAGSFPPGPGRRLDQRPRTGGGGPAQTVYSPHVWRLTGISAPHPGSL